MRALTVPGWNGSGPEHWQTLWEKEYGLHRVRQEDWSSPEAGRWTDALDKAISACPDSVVIIAHSLGCWVLIHWASLYPDRSRAVQSALLVAPPDIETAAELPESVRDFARHEVRRLQFPSMLVGSENDPYMPLHTSRTLAHLLGSSFINAGFAGHINVDSGHGPWPEGQSLLRRLLCAPQA